MRKFLLSLSLSLTFLCLACPDDAKNNDGAGSSSSEFCVKLSTSAYAEALTKKLELSDTKQISPACDKTLALRCSDEDKAKFLLLPPTGQGGVTGPSGLGALCVIGVQEFEKALSPLNK